MKKPTITTFQLIILSIISYLSLTQSEDLIEQTCKLTPFYDLCINSLKSSPPDMKGLATTMADVILGNTTETLNYIEVLIKQSKDPKEEHDLANCAELYRPIVKFNIPQAIEALSKSDFGFAHYVLKDAGKGVDDCEKGFSGGRSPLSDRNQVLSDLCDVGIAILEIALNG